jgi:hypothetical protein
MFPKHGAPWKTEAHCRALLNIAFWDPCKGALPPRPPRGVLFERDDPFYYSKSLVYEPPPDCRFPSGVKGPLWREAPVCGAFLNVSSRVSIKWALPRCPPHWASPERDTPFLEVPSSFEVPGRWALFQVPQLGTCGNRCLSPEPVLPILQVTQQGSPHSRFSPKRETLHLLSTISLSKSLVDQTTAGCPTPWRERCPSP